LEVDELELAAVELLLELDESDEVVLELDESEELLEPELAAASFLGAELEPLSLLSASRVEPNVPAERLSVL